MPGTPLCLYPDPPVSLLHEWCAAQGGGCPPLGVSQYALKRRGPECSGTPAGRGPGPCPEHRPGSPSAPRPLCLPSLNSNDDPVGGGSVAHPSSAGDAGGGRLSGFGCRSHHRFRLSLPLPVKTLGPGSRTCNSSLLLGREYTPLPHEYCMRPRDLFGQWKVRQHVTRLRQQWQVHPVLRSPPSSCPFPVPRGRASAMAAPGFRVP